MRHLITLLCLLAAEFCLMGQSTLRFDFGGGKVEQGYVQVKAASLYSERSGYGFEPGAKLQDVVRQGSDALCGDFVTSDGELIKFSARLPEGNYKVTVGLGDVQGNSRTTIKAEERRLMLEEVVTENGQTRFVSFLVNIRTPQLSPGNKMKLDVREWDPVTDKSVTATWDDKLTLRFSNKRPCINSVVIEPYNDAVTVFLIGDSTVTDQVTEPYGTWGQNLTRWFKEPVVIANHAESGQTIKGFRFQRRWDKVLDLIREGDYVMMQFGHNDLNKNGHDAMWETEDNAGNWLNTYSDALTDYKWGLATLALEVQRRGATPIIVSPMTKMDMKTGIANKAGMRDYPRGAKEAAELVGCEFIDLFTMSVELSLALGTLEAPKAYVEGLHSNGYGGYIFARCIAKAIADSSLPLSDYLDPRAADFNVISPLPQPRELNLPIDPMVDVPVPPGMKAFFNQMNKK